MKSSLLQVFGWPVHYVHSLYVWMKLIIDSLMDSQQKEPKGITNEECEKTYVQAETSTRAEPESEDTVDFPVKESVLQALEGVSVAIYKMCISNWHCPPEEMKKQPLFKEINTAIHDIYHIVKAKVRPLEEYEILIAVVNALITHLKNFRKKKMTYRYNTSQEEADFLRKQTNYLLLHWLPDSLRNSNHIMVFLKEILSINVLRPSINNLADPTFINETIVKTLDSEEFPEKKARCETHSVLCEPYSIREDDGDSYIYTSDNVTHRKKKGLVSTIKGKVNRWKSRKNEKGSVFRSFTRPCDSTDGCTHTGFSDESDEGYLRSSFSDSFLEKCIQENWTAKICENPTQDRHTYKICVSKKSSFSTKLWITERSVKDFRKIYSLICREYQDLEIFNTLEKIEEADIDEDSQFFQAVGVNPDAFIESLLKLIKLHQKPGPIFFFSPFSYEEGSELFSTVFSDYDEDLSAAESEIEDESDESSDDPNGCYENDGYRMFQMKKKKKTNKKSKDGSGSKREDTSGPNTSTILRSTEDHTSPILEKDIAHRMARRKKPEFKAAQSYTTKFSTDPSSVPTDEPSVNYFKLYESKPMSYLGQDEEINAQRKKLEVTFLDALYHLADELFAGGNFRIQFLQTTGMLNKISNDILASIPKLYAEDQIAWYLNQTSELLLADACPLPVPPDKLPLLAQKTLKSKLQSLLTNKIIKTLFERNILKNITASHEAFQNSKANKETLFRIFEELTKIITNGPQETRKY
ncbi:uncharacterized protein ACMZJ9_013723 [Mantella aurantiaca]